MEVKCIRIIVTVVISARTNFVIYTLVTLLKLRPARTIIVRFQMSDYREKILKEQAALADRFCQLDNQVCKYARQSRMLKALWGKAPVTIDVLDTEGKLKYGYTPDGGVNIQIPLWMRGVDYPEILALIRLGQQDRRLIDLILPSLGPLTEVEKAYIQRMTDMIYPLQRVWAYRLYKKALPPLHRVMLDNLGQRWLKGMASLSHSMLSFHTFHEYQKQMITLFLLYADDQRPISLTLGSDWEPYINLLWGYLHLKKPNPGCYPIIWRTLEPILDDKGFSNMVDTWSFEFHKPEIDMPWDDGTKEVIENLSKRRIGVHRKPTDYLHIFSAISFKHDLKAMVPSLLSSI